MCELEVADVQATSVWILHRTRRARIFKALLASHRGRMLQQYAFAYLSSMLRQFCVDLRRHLRKYLWRHPLPTC